MTIAAVVCGIVATALFLVLPGILGLGHPSSSELPLWLRNAQAGADIFQNLITALAIPIGAIWAYFRFFKERTYASRLQPTISGTVARRDGRIYLRASASVKNIGQSRVVLNHEYIGLRVLTRTSGVVNWSLYRTEDVFKEQLYVESGVTIGEPVWVEMPEKDKARLMPRRTNSEADVGTIPGSDKVALRLDLYVAESETVGWLAREVVNLVAEVDNKQESAQPDLPTNQQTDVLTRLKERIGKWLSLRV